MCDILCVCVWEKGGMRSVECSFILSVHKIPALLWCGVRMSSSLPKHTFMWEILNQRRLAIFRFFFFSLSVFLVITLASRTRKTHNLNGWHDVFMSWQIYSILFYRLQQPNKWLWRCYKLSQLGFIIT